MMRRLFSTGGLSVLLAVLLCTLGACRQNITIDDQRGNNPVTPSNTTPKVERVIISTPSLGITLTNSCFATIDLTAEVFGQNLTAAHQKVKWTTPVTDGMVLTVVDDIRARLTITKTGNFPATATAEGVEKTVTVIVNGPCGSSTSNPPSNPGPGGPVAKPTVSLTATPMEMGYGGTTTLKFNSTNATSCRWLSGKTGNTDLNGTDQAVLTITTTFTWECSNSAGSVSDTKTVVVTGGACPTSIDYSPKSTPTNLVAKNGTATANVDNWPVTSCDPFWYVKNGAYLSILGADKVVTIKGAKYFAGPNAVVKGIFQGSDEACVQTSIVENNTFKCRPWSVFIGSGLEALGMQFPEKLPIYNIYNSPDVRQTPHWLK